MKKKTKNICSLIKRITGILFVLLQSLNNQAQSDILQKKVTADFQNIRLNDAFRLIEKQLTIYFTFDGSLINTNRIVKESFKAVPLKTCLDKLLNDSALTYKVIENHVIIRHRDYYVPPDTLEKEKPKFLIIRGQIIDRINREPLPYATISVTGTGYGVVSNTGGEFILKIPETLENTGICISHLGYSNIYAAVNQIIDTNSIFMMERNYISIQEVIIRKTDAKNLLRNALKRIKNNYPTDPVYLTAFYRESVNKGKEFMFYSEAIMQVYKASYTSIIDDDMIKVLKSRKMQDISMEDTVIVKLKSGLQASLGLDIVRNPIEFLDEENFQDYIYSMTDIVSMNNRDAYLIEFEPKEYAEDAIFEGKIYIDIQDLAIVSCEFKIKSDRLSQNEEQFIAKKNKGIKIKLSNIDYRVDYRCIGDKFYLNHAKGEINMKVKKQGKLFSFNFDISFELSVNEVDTLNVERFKRKETARLQTIFFDEIYEYDEKFWENYNYIKPDKSLHETLKRETFK